VTKGAKNAEDGDIFIRETDVKEKLVETKADRENTRDKERLKEVAEIICRTHRGVGEKAEDKEVKDAEKLGESGPGSDTIREGETAPDKEEEKGRVEWVASEILTLEDDDEESETRDTDTEELRKREGNLVQREAYILRRIVE
jgi:hypothetical protein